ncbi:MAG: cobalamin biosynthesis protein [Deltaproteobacteria bacterium]|nr:cobalamin biosynthesis protein [Deltaproteobacteria bacterium]
MNNDEKHQTKRSSPALSSAEGKSSGASLRRLAVYALTAPGAELAAKIAAALGGTVFLPKRLENMDLPPGLEASFFDKLAEPLSSRFNDFDGHVVVAATGLTVRLIGPLLRDKKTDPAVVALGQDGRFVVSLLSGHLGGADNLARQVALTTMGQAVINTATDIEKVPSLEVTARDLGLRAPDLFPLPEISRRLSEHDPVAVYDPGNHLLPSLRQHLNLFQTLSSPPRKDKPAVSVDYRLTPPETYAASAARQSVLGQSVLGQTEMGANARSLGQGDDSKVLHLYPPVLAAGLGCHRDCPAEDLLALLEESLISSNLSIHSLAVLATVVSRGDPQLAPSVLARRLSLPLLTYSPDQLDSVQTPNPSETVRRRIGAASVCEAAARLAARLGPLLVDKRKGEKSTCAIALISSS